MGVVQADIWREATVSRSITHPAIIVTYLTTTVRVNATGSTGLPQLPSPPLSSKDSAISGLGDRPDRRSQVRLPYQALSIVDQAFSSSLVDRFTSLVYWFVKLGVRPIRRSQAPLGLSLIKPSLPSLIDV